jgi:hypothetical protein
VVVEAIVEEEQERQVSNLVDLEVQVLKRVVLDL